MQAGIVSQAIPIHDIQLAEITAPMKHWRILSQRYGKRPGWKLLGDRLEEILNKPCRNLISLCRTTTELTLEVFRIKPKIISASKLSVEGSKGKRVINLVRAVGGTTYLSGAGAREYLDAGEFESAGLGICFQEFANPIYVQSVEGLFQPAAFALEWYFEDPDHAVDNFHKHLRLNAKQLPRCIY